MTDADYSNEIWKDIPGYEGLYQASSMGRVRSADRLSRITTPSGAESSFLRKGRILKLALARDGYLYVELMRSGKESRKRHAVQRLVCSAFNGSSQLHAAHKDGVRTHNAESNLYWATRLENEADKLAHGKRRGMQKLSESQVREIRHSDERTAILCERFGMSQVSIDRIRRGLGWAHVE